MFSLFIYSISDHEAKVDKELKGVDEEDALRKLLTSDEEEEEENEEKKNEEENKSEQEEQSPNEELSTSSAAKKKKKKESPTKSNSDTKKEGKEHLHIMNSFSLIVGLRKLFGIFRNIFGIQRWKFWFG